MSRSRRKHDIIGLACHHHISEKKDKKASNRRFRSSVKQALRSGKDILPLRRELSDLWSFSKDGKTYFGELKYGGKRDKGIYDSLRRK